MSEIVTEWVRDCKGISESRFVGSEIVHKIIVKCDGMTVVPAIGYLFAALCRVTGSRIETRAVAKPAPDQATLPKSIEFQQDDFGATIKDMRDGQEAYTMPWGMYADADGRLWLNGSYPISRKIGGTSRMIVSKKNGEYFVNMSNCQGERYKPGDGEYIGDFTPIPVCGISGIFGPTTTR